MIDRNAAPFLRQLMYYYPVVTVTGPRQSGKTTLCQALFPEKRYVSLESIDQAEYAQSDPRGFLAEYAKGAIIDEVQYAPGLLRYLQVEVDARPEPGRFLLTGSQHFGLLETITETLAGRTGILYLLPLCHEEIGRFPTPPNSLFEWLFTGGYPRIHDRQILASRWHADYITTYIQRDVRQVLKVGNLNTFTTFLRLCAGRAGQILNLSALGSDCGVSHNTARAWLSVLETSFILFRLPAWHRNIKKQLIKSPKLHFFDTGLLCRLLGLREMEQLRHHPLRGAVFENWVVSEVYKEHVNRGLDADLFYFRDRKGLEIDLVLESAEQITLVEMKSGATVSNDFFRPLKRVHDLIEGSKFAGEIELRLVCGGGEVHQRGAVKVIPWSSLADVDWSC